MRDFKNKLLKYFIYEYNKNVFGNNKLSYQITNLQKNILVSFQGYIMIFVI